MSGKMRTLREWLDFLGAGQRETARAIEMDERTFRRYVLREREPSVSAALQICDQLGISHPRMVDWARVE